LEFCSDLNDKEEAAKNHRKYRYVRGWADPLSIRFGQREPNAPAKIVE
jgi:hypothetical protein